MLAVLEKRLRIPFSDLDVYLNIVGGLRVTDRAVDLAICAALVSAHLEHSFPVNSAFCGEVGLTGEIRPVGNLKQRVKGLESAGKLSCVAYVPKTYNSSTKLKLQSYQSITAAFGSYLQ